MIVLHSISQTRNQTNLANVISNQQISRGLQLLSLRIDKNHFKLFADQHSFASLYSLSLPDSNYDWVFYYLLPSNFNFNTLFS